MKIGEIVKVYTNSIVGWESGALVKQYQVIEEDVMEKWLIKTETGIRIARYVKNSKIKEDGCGYVVKTECKSPDIELLAKLFVKIECRQIRTLAKIQKAKGIWAMKLKEVYNLSTDDIIYFNRQVYIEMGLIVL